MKLEVLQANSSVGGILSDEIVTVANVRWFGSDALELTYKTPAGKVANEILYRHDETRLRIVESGRPWSFDGAGALFRLVSEAQRIRLAHLFDPLLAVHTSVVDPLPHQITAVYESMLPRQPLRFLLADDPGAETEAAEKLGYDIESTVPGTGRLRFIEVKGRVTGAATITVTLNEILYSLNKPDDFILAIVEFLDDGKHEVHYVRTPFTREPDIGVTSVNYSFLELLAKAEKPS